MNFDHLKSLFENSGFRRDSNSQSGFPKCESIWECVNSFLHIFTHIPGSVNVTPGLQSQPVPFHAFTLVTSPRLGSWQILLRMWKGKKQMCKSSCSMGFSLDHKTWKLMPFMWREVSHVVGFLSFGRRLWISKMKLTKKKQLGYLVRSSYPRPHLFVHWECRWSTNVKYTHQTFGGSCKISKHCSYFNMSKSFL